ncbi:ADP-forming succinate--CoA ligase subunit beta [Candidatus Aerophobetes bacterium]|uniref:ADP-forming succinate--CoA ligase subunit beta n=1 Tax=Aerophobetes bacterium TaxID=2030807 RepID=A0A523W2J1_UNCAE|nr:MAG: ADP-forming succinate--CoA ligase subunit beta [Candidatus Aerophobetes bacterium]
MRIHEYEAKNLFKQSKIPVPRGNVATSPEDARRVAGQIGLPVTIKAQVLIGGRGRAGGIKFSEDLGEVEELTRKVLGMKIEGYEADSVLVEEKLEVKEELYLGVTIDGSLGCPVLMTYSEGAVEIEETARRHPEKVFSRHLKPFGDLRAYQARELAKKLGFEGKPMLQLASVIISLYGAFKACDALIAEINPLVVTKRGDFVAADAVLEIDDSALFRHPEFGTSPQDRIPDELEREAGKIGVSYVNMDGDIGLICSGAGLGMATMDMIREKMRPANFLETGGGMTRQLMAGALRVVLKKPNLKAVFINIYGGINPIHEGAKGIVDVVRQKGVKIPIVAKALGNRQEETWETLESVGIKVVKETQTMRAVEELFRTLKEERS